jgi:predicted DNA-binding protein
MYAQITTARLPLDTRNKLMVLSRTKHKTKSDIIKESLDMYYEYAEGEIDSFTLGEHSFGKYGSGDSDRTTTYKDRIKTKLSTKMSADRPPRAQLNTH